MKQQAIAYPRMSAEERKQRMRTEFKVLTNRHFLDETHDNWLRVIAQHESMTTDAVRDQIEILVIWPSLHITWKLHYDQAWSLESRRGVETAPTFHEAIERVWFLWSDQMAVQEHETAITHDYNRLGGADMGYDYHEQRWYFRGSGRPATYDHHHGDFSYDQIRMAEDVCVAKVRSQDPSEIHEAATRWTWTLQNLHEGARLDYQTRNELANAWAELPHPGWEANLKDELRWIRLDQERLIARRHMTPDWMEAAAIQARTNMHLLGHDQADEEHAWTLQLTDQEQIEWITNEYGI